MTTEPRELEDFALLLETFGGDRTRWPADDRRRFARLLSASPEARRLLSEAEALDRLLDEAPRLSPAREARLAESIMAAATEERPKVVSMPKTRRATPTRIWPAAALLAASLLAGVFAGMTGMLDDVMTPETQLALDDETLVDEDLL